MIRIQIFWGNLTLSRIGPSLGLGIEFCCCLSLHLKPTHGFPFQTALMTLSRDTTAGSSHLFRQNIETSSVPLGSTSGRCLRSGSCTLRISSPRYPVSHSQAGFLNRLRASLHLHALGLDPLPAGNVYKAFLFGTGGPQSHIASILIQHHQ